MLSVYKLNYDWRLDKLLVCLQALSMSRYVVDEKSHRSSKLKPVDSDAV